MYYVGFRFDGATTTDPMMVTLVDALLSNGKGSGIFDLNLKLNQKILDGYSTFSNNKDYTIHKLYGMPKQGQSLEQVKDLLLSQIDSIKQGNFPDWMLSAVIDNMRLDKLRAAETNSGRVFDVVFAFVKDVPLKTHLAELEVMSKVTKADIVKFANEHYGENYAVCYKAIW
jgi:zinc protease